MERRESTFKARYHSKLCEFLDGQKITIFEFFLGTPSKKFTYDELAEKPGIGRGLSSRLRELKLAGLIRERKVLKDGRLVKTYKTAEHAIRDFIRRMEAGGFADEKLPAETIKEMLDQTRS